MSVAFGSAQAGMAKEGLDVADVGAVFEEMGREGVAEAVDCDFFGYIGVENGFVENMLGGTDG